MSVKSMYIPKSKKAVEVAKVLGLTAADVRGRYVCNIAQDLTPEQAVQIFYILDPVGADSQEENAWSIAHAALDNPSAGGWTMEQAEAHFNYTIRGGWAL